MKIRVKNYERKYLEIDRSQLNNKIETICKSDNAVCTKLKALWRKECRNEESRSDEMRKTKEKWPIEIAQRINGMANGNKQEDKEKKNSKPHHKTNNININATFSR